MEVEFVGPFRVEATWMQVGNCRAEMLLLEALMRWMEEIRGPVGVSSSLVLLLIRK